MSQPIWMTNSAPISGSCWLLSLKAVVETIAIRRHQAHCPFEAFFQLLAECSQTAHLVQLFDSTTARAHVSAAGAKATVLRVKRRFAF
jgi:hypothetical protein